MRALTGIRGIAALWVFFFHFGPTHSFWLFSNGYLGVDLFFMLSGFILTHVYQNSLHFTNSQSLLHFYRNRMVRIFPLHLVALAFVVIAVVSVPNFVSSFEEGFFRWPDLWKNVLLIHAWTSFSAGWNGPAWSLSAEWLAYLLFPLGLAFLRKASLRLCLVYACLLLATLTAFYYATSLDQMAHAGKTGMLRMFVSFSVGLCLYRLFQANTFTPNAYLSFAFFLGCVFFGVLQPLVLWAFALLILLSAQEQSFVSKALSSKFAFYLGEISFSFYILQWIIIELGRYTIHHGAAPLVVWPIVFVTTFVFSSLSYRYIEVPSRQWSHKGK